MERLASAHVEPSRPRAFVSFADIAVFRDIGPLQDLYERLDYPMLSSLLPEIPLAEDELQSSHTAWYCLVHSLLENA